MTPEPAFIIVWRFLDAPKHLQHLSTNGGDEDWLALVPKELCGQAMWLECTHFGCCDVSEYDVDEGKVYIGSHS